MATTYRLYFETPYITAEALPLIHALARKALSAYTLYIGDGAWEGTISPSYTLEVLHLPDIHTVPRDNLKDTVFSLACDIKERFAQDAVLMTTASCDSTMI